MYLLQNVSRKEKPGNNGKKPSPRRYVLGTRFLREINSSLVCKQADEKAGGTF